jgi:hypothetical protein
MTFIIHTALLLAAIPLSQQRGVDASRMVRVVTADGRASLRIIGSAVDRVRTSARVAEQNDFTTVTAPAGTGVTEVIVPRDDRLEVHAGSGSVVIEDVAAVAVTKASGELRISNIAGSVSVEMSSGNAVVRRAGSFEGVTGTANLTIVDVTGAVVVTSINGRTTVSCIGGAVSVSDTNGVIDVRASRGDVTIETTSGRATWTGVPLASRRYRLKTLSGVVKLAGRGALRDAAISLSTHAGHLSSDVALQVRDTNAHGPTRRLARTFGSGGTRIDLDAFDGNVELQWNERGEDDENCSRGDSAVRRRDGAGNDTGGG